MHIYVTDYTLAHHMCIIGTHSYLYTYEHYLLTI